MPNPLDPILAWYATVNDCVRVTRRVIELGVAGAITDQHVFFTQGDQQKQAGLDRAQLELDRLVVLGLVAVFERTLRDHLAALPVIGAPTGVPLHEQVRENIVKDMERWSLSPGVLELFAAVDPTLRGQVKQIVQYRNWVAHGHTLNQPPPVSTNPAKAHRRLTDFLIQAGVIVP
jgi:hypothetical protein